VRSTSGLSRPRVRLGPRRRARPRSEDRQSWRIQTSRVRLGQVVQHQRCPQIRPEDILSVITSLCLRPMGMVFEVGIERLDRPWIDFPKFLSSFVSQACDQEGEAEGCIPTIELRLELLWLARKHLRIIFWASFYIQTASLGEIPDSITTLNVMSRWLIERSPDLHS